jgi:hypothetical protein
MTTWDSAVRAKRAAYSHPWLAGALSALDLRLRRRLAVFEYSNDPSCVFRLDITRARQTLVLRDGTRIRRGQRIARLHFWSEQLPPMPKNGPTIGWARRMQRAMALSFRDLARYIASRPDLGDIAAIWGVAPSGTSAQSGQLARIMARFGFEALIEPEHLGLRERLHRFGENILISLVVFARNAGALRTDTLNRARLSIYMSRRVLEKEFSDGEERTSGA